MEQVSATPEDTRDIDPMPTSERESLDAWLDMYRSILTLKVAGLTATQLCEASAAPSNLTLIGLVRHLSEVERYWFGDVVLGLNQDTIYSESDDGPGGDFEGRTPDTAFADLETYHQEVARARARSTTVTDLGAALPGLRHGKPVNLRWVLAHMIEEYARHLGHADLLRERIDGATGY